MSAHPLRLKVAVLLAASLTSGCTLTFAPGLLQSLRLSFDLSSRLEQDAATVVQSLFFPEEVRLKKRFVRVAGRLDAANALPSRLELVAETVDADSGRRLHTFKLSLKVDGDGTFGATKKFPRNLAAGSLMTITVEPRGSDLDAGSSVVLCLDVVKKKSDLVAVSCSTGREPGPTATLSELQAEIFTPSCARAGCHDSASASEGLVLEAGSTFSEVVNVPSNQSPFRLRIEPGNADNSYLVKKVRGDSDISGVKMPLDGPPFLSEAQIQRLASWIESGAPNN